MSTAITRAVLNYQDTGEGWDDLRKKITVYAYEFPHRWTDWDEDRCSDFFLAFYPKIPGLVRRFRPQFTFETYLACSLRWFIKTFLIYLSERQHHAEWLEREMTDRMDELSVEEEDEEAAWNPEVCPLEIDGTGRVANPVIRRRVLFAFLLHIDDIEISRLPGAAALMGVDADWLLGVMEELREFITHKLERREELRRRRNECWYKMEAAESRAEVEGPYDEISRRTWERRTRTWRSRYDTAAEGLRRLRIKPSHNDIAQVLNLPEGTVASGIFLLKKHLEMMGSGSSEHSGPHLHHRIKSGYGNSLGHRKSPQNGGASTHTQAPLGVKPPDSRREFPRR